MSQFQTLGLSVKVFDPLVLGGAFLYSLDREVEGYQHTIAAYGGFDTSQFSLSGKAIDVEEWYERGLGRHIEVWCDELVKIWEGCVNIVNLNEGKLTASVGPLTDLANRVSTVYRLLDTTVNPPVAHDPGTTTISQDLDSQAKYGKWEKVIEEGSCSVAEANYARDSFLASQARPGVSQDTHSSQNNAASVTLNLRGYSDWLSAYIYAQTAVSGTTSLSAQIQAILAADTNAIFSTDYSRIATNGALTDNYKGDADFADSLVKKLIGLGDVSANRWLFGIYENRVAWYQPAPTTLEYVQSIQGNDKNVYTPTGSLVRPWLVRPGKWCRMTDFLVGKPSILSLTSDLRNIFVEQVEYIAPYEVNLKGGKYSQLPQIMAQISNGGMF